MHAFDGLFDAASAQRVMEILIKLGIGAVLGGAIGWEREKHGRPAGIRTHMLVVIGVILFTEVSRAFDGDPGRVASQVVTGIGFLGAGSILRLGAEVKGLTTAASIWASAAIAMCVSMAGPFLLVAIIATGLSLFTLAVVDSFEHRIVPNSHRRVCQLQLLNPSVLGAAIAEIRKAGGSIEAVNVLAEGTPFVVQLTVTGNSDRLLEGLSKVEGLSLVEWVS